MKNLIRLLIVVAVLSSCQSEQKKSNEQTTEKQSPAAENKEKLLVLPWTATLNQETQKMELKYNPASDVSNLQVQDMVDAINLKYPNIKLMQEGQQHDTILVSIDDAAYLTQQMGTAGAETYLAEATFALTELQDITAVHFLFKEGDHAAPKTYSREDFQDLN